MKVSTRGDYASRALLSLALNGDGHSPTPVRDIAKRTGLPQPYLEQILLALKGAGLVRSKRGVGGGYTLARAPAEIRLSQIVSAVDGPIVAGDFNEPHTHGACDHEGQCVLSPSGAALAHTCGLFSSHSPWRTSPTLPEARTHGPESRSPALLAVPVIQPTPQVVGTRR